jgi:hypothetical protein
MSQYTVTEHDQYSTFVLEEFTIARRLEALARRMALAAPQWNATQSPQASRSSSTAAILNFGDDRDIQLGHLGPADEQVRESSCLMGCNN